jgi:ABC-type transporter Mla MlaB component
MEGPTEKVTAQTNTQSLPGPRGSAPLVRSSSFKYYIHDGSDTFRLALLGELTEAEVTDLTGCWNTARTTLGKRNLILDLRGLRNVDDAGKRWLAEMAQEGAVYVPDSFLRNALADHTPEPKPPKTGFWGRLLAAFRGARIPAVD